MFWFVFYFKKYILLLNLKSVMKLAHRCGGLATTCVYNADTGSLIFCSLPIFQLRPQANDNYNSVDKNKCSSSVDLKKINCYL